jgi:hypothetical protein
MRCPHSAVDPLATTACATPRPKVRLCQRLLYCNRAASAGAVLAHTLERRLPSPYH